VGPMAGEFFPEANDWRTEMVDLAPLKDLGAVQIYFVNIGYYGNNLFLDNINILGSGALVDADNDGFYDFEDCDDDNPDVNPDADENPYNGIDDDCNPLTLDDDLDQDGFLLIDDCDDLNSMINPDAIEIDNNGIDEDCDGLDGTSSTVEIGDVTVKTFPNPVSHQFYLESSKPIKVDLELFDINGKRMMNYNRISLPSSLDLSELTPGVYLLKVSDGQNDSHNSIRIIKQ